MRTIRATAFLLFALCAAALAHAVPVFEVELVAKYPQDRDAFTQGIVWHDGHLYMSTGLYGRSTLRAVELESGRVTRMVRLDRREFGEDVTVMDGLLLQLTWMNERGYVYDPETLERRSRFRYEGEGWGLTHDGTQLVMSDGSDVLKFLSPHTFRVHRRVRVTADGQRVRMLNAMQYVDGKIYANVWHTTRIAEIDPTTGTVSAWIELAPLLPHLGFEPDLEVESPNGIAFDPERRRLFVTGKLWPWLFEVRIRRDGGQWP